MKRDERLPQAALARVLLNAIEKAEQLGEPDIAEIVRDALRSWSTRATTWKTTRSRNSPCMTRGSSQP